ncbi:hypothetical protein BJ742DRAFT_794346 [Cladochytrium replicatum]|nr:hypothetical protein BJ742DRAFT_794346 [Cladochytrium replicatum]
MSMHVRLSATFFPNTVSLRACFPRQQIRQLRTVTATTPLITFSNSATQRIIRPTTLVALGCGITTGTFALLKYSSPIHADSLPSQNGITTAPPPLQVEKQLVESKKSFGVADAASLVTVDMSIGFCVGYFMKKTGRVVAFTVGLIVVFLQVLARYEIITISWKSAFNRMGRSIADSPHEKLPNLETGEIQGRQEVTTSDVLRGIGHILFSTLRWLFAGTGLLESAGFMGGFYAGIKLG